MFCAGIRQICIWIPLLSGAMLETDQTVHADFSESTQGAHV